MNPNLNTVLCDLCDAIRSVTLGSVEKSVMYESGKALILNWNDHNKDDQVDEQLELDEWEQEIDVMN
jgi:hypothetical protein